MSGATDPKGSLGGRGQAGAGFAIESPAVEGADKLTVSDFTERLKVSIAVRATSLHDVSADFDIGLVAAVTTPCCKLEFANHLSLGAPHSLTRQ